MKLLKFLPVFIGFKALTKIDAFKVDLEQRESKTQISNRRLTPRNRTKYKFKCKIV